MVRSIQARLAIAIGLSVTLLWLAAAAITVKLVSGEMLEVFDDGLKSTAQRILPIADHDLSEGGRREHAYSNHNEDRDDDDDEDEDRKLRSGRQARYGEDVTFIVRSRSGDVLLRSKDADESIFPAFERTGFRTTDTHQLYYEKSSDGRMTIAVAEPLEQRTELFNKMLFGLLAPLIVVIPISLIAIVLGVRNSFRPIRDFQQGLSSRGPQDLSPLPGNGLPSELMPISAAVNELLKRLKAAFDAERTFAANAAHELRTPVAGAIAQAQRIRAESKEDFTADRAGEIETTLKRLMRMSEKLMQLARAEGGRLTNEEAMDLRPVLQMIVGDFERTGETRIDMHLPAAPFVSKLDPDAFGILCRNLIENGLKHGAEGGQVSVSLGSDGVLRVANDGPPLTSETMARLMKPFERGNGKIAGNGLGLAIVKAIAERAGGELMVISPRKPGGDGVEVQLRLPTA